MKGGGGSDWLPRKKLPSKRLALLGLMKNNAYKWHLLVSASNTVKTKTGNFDINSSKSEKLLGVKFNHKLS